MAGVDARPRRPPFTAPVTRVATRWPAEAISFSARRWAEGGALVATGSPFPLMQVGDASPPVAQCSNVCIFPGVGLAVTAVRAARVTGAMMTAAAAAVGDAAIIRRDPRGTLLPDRAQLAGIRGRRGERRRQGRSRRCRRARAHR